MSKHIEELSKDLAGGMSRRKAFWRFCAGVGGALFATKKASAGITNLGSCVEYCRGQGLSPLEFDECVIASALCPKDECALIANGRHILCVPHGTA
jgi:hypothetical protein